MNKSQLAFINSNKSSIDQSTAVLPPSQNVSPTQALPRSLSLAGMTNPNVEGLARLLEMQKTTNGSMDDKLMEAFRMQWLNTTAGFKQPPNIPATNPLQSQLLLQIIAQAQGKFPSNSLLNPSAVMNNSSNNNNKPIKQSNSAVNNPTHANLTKKQLQAKLAHSEQMLMQQQRQLSQINGTINQLDGSSECAGGMNNRSPSHNTAANSNNQFKKILPHISSSPQMMSVTNGNGLPAGIGLLNDLKQANGQMHQPSNGLIMANSPTAHLNGLHHTGVEFMQPLSNQQQSHKLSALK